MSIGLAEDVSTETKKDLFSKKKSKVKTGIEDRKTEEIILAFVGPVGSNVPETAKIFEKILSSDYSYTTSYHKVSKIIKECAHFVNMKYNNSCSPTKRILTLQDIGNKIREIKGKDYLARNCIAKIGIERGELGYYDKKTDGTLVPKSARHVHIIDSLKNPAEYEFLKNVYGEMCWLIGVFAPEANRRGRLLKSGVDHHEIDHIIYRDQDEEEETGQKVRKLIQRSDLFLRNDSDNVDRLETTIIRFLELLFGTALHTPTQDEMAMQQAAAAAANSACISRQVGAAIYGSNAELLGIGWNDAPKYGGGLYTSNDERKDDHRCVYVRNHKCKNDETKETIYQEIADNLKNNKVITKKKYEIIVSVLKETKLNDIIEYSRATHAEMEAILSIARSCKNGLKGAILYSTTYPCHNCARHIVAAGIKKVVYIEPYPKSLALELHGDSISMDEKDINNKVVFLQYEGVSPRNIKKLFHHGKGRKSKVDGSFIKINKRHASPLYQKYLDSFTDYEKKVVEELGKEAIISM